jgi:formate dehydrogenase major subunit
MITHLIDGLVRAREERVMGLEDSLLTRRQLYRGFGAVGASTLAGLGFDDLKPVQAAATRLKIKGAREVPSICPYCAVGCAQIVSVRQGEIVNIEGHPDSPINRGTLCPKGSAAFQLAVNPNRLTKVKYRAPHATEWAERDLDWAGKESGTGPLGKESGTGPLLAIWASRGAA